MWKYTSANTHTPTKRNWGCKKIIIIGNTPTVCTEWSSELFHALHSFTFVIQPKLPIRTQRGRSAGIISRLKNSVGWFFVREKYCSGWKNKPNKTDYKPDEQGQRLVGCNKALSIIWIVQIFLETYTPPKYLKTGNTKVSKHTSILHLSV
jgi:hypothetical protein